MSEEDEPLNPFLNEEEKNYKIYEVGIRKTMLKKDSQTEIKLKEDFNKIKKQYDKLVIEYIKLEKENKKLEDLLNKHTKEFVKSQNKPKKSKLPEDLHNLLTSFL